MFISRVFLHLNSLSHWLHLNFFIWSPGYQQAGGQQVFFLKSFFFLQKKVFFLRAFRFRFLGNHTYLHYLMKKDENIITLVTFRHTDMTTLWPPRPRGQSLWKYCGNISVICLHFWKLLWLLNQRKYSMTYPYLTAKFKTYCNNILTTILHWNAIVTYVIEA